VLAASLRTGTITSVTLEAVTPTGDVDRGLGSGELVLEPFWTLGQILPGDAFVQSQIGAGLPVSRRQNLFRDAGAAFRSWTPMLELLVASDMPEPAPEWTLVPQLQVSLPRRQHVLLNVGVGLPVEDGGIGASEVLVYLLWDWYDGGLMEGW
jgi:hypothetical protein